VSIVLEQLLALPDENARREFLDSQAGAIDVAASQTLADALKAQADHYLRAEIQTSFQFARLLIHWGELTHNPFHRALGLRAEANALSIGLGHYREALDTYNEAAAIYRAHGRTLDEAKAQIGKVWPLAALGQYTEALQCGEQITQVLEAYGEWRQLADITMNLGVIFSRLGQEVGALAQFNRAIEAYERINSVGLYLALQNRAEVLRNLGQFEASIQSSLSAYEGLQANDQNVEAARSKNNLAITHFMLGRYNRALQLLDEASYTFASDGRMRDVAEAKLFKSDCLLQLRRFNQALEECQLARAQFAEYGTQFEVAQSYLNEALAQTGLKKHSEAILALAQARQLFQQEGNLVWVATTDLELAGVLLRQNEPGAACKAALNCARLFRLRSLPIKQAQAKLLAAQAAFAAADANRANRLVADVLNLIHEKEIPWLAYGAHVLVGQMAHARGDIAAAMSAYDQAIDQMEQMRGRMMVEYRADYLEDKQFVYEQAVALCLDAYQPEAALVYAERAKSRSLLDLLAYRLDLSVRARNVTDEFLVQELTALRAERGQLVRRTESQMLETRNPKDLHDSNPARLVELEKQITERWHTLLVRNADYAREADLWQVRTAPAQSYLAPDETLLEYFVVQEQLMVFVISSTEVGVHRLPVSLAQIQTLVRSLWLNLKTVPESPPERTGSLARNAQQMLQRLHGALMAPLQLPQAQRIIIVPHGPLHYVPFHALFADGHYLIEQHEVSYLPSSSVLAYCRKPVGETAQAGIVKPARQVATFGYSRRGQLPHAVEEARAIAKMWHGQAFLEDEATLDQLHTVAPSSDVLHLAMHGDYRADNPLFSGLLFADGSLTTLDTFNLRLRASLVTLSACQTGRNAISGGDELSGLMRGFLGAGAASLVLSLWRAEDQSTAQLMQIFYTQLLAGQSKAAALRTAQCALLRAHAHPYFWAPFLLVGDSGPL